MGKKPQHPLVTMFLSLFAQGVFPDLRMPSEKGRTIKARDPEREGAATAKRERKNATRAYNHGRCESFNPVCKTRDLIVRA